MRAGFLRGNMLGLGWLGLVFLSPGGVPPNAPLHWSANADQYDYQPTPTLGQDLRRGGYVIYFRHALTDRTVRDRDIRNNLSNCTAQRNLSSAGQQQAQAIGQAFQTANIPIGRVVASPYCRTLDTARLAFGRVEPEPALLAIFYNRSLGDVRVTAMFQLLSTLPTAGTNTILIGHGVNLAAAAEIDLPEGGAAVVRPQGNNRFSLVAIVPPQAWPEQLSR
ncbi:phosphoglycerate mutase family protein [Gloeomargarita lithophora Alchichica-D10]|uniref:Phosphoglycerate mutase family protein n=1 Tax=Gloeomargarita lithophora Alchichica-D10 TaxID=1188229 RepID=A0A1J0AGG6_9CYAN|nr:histidine phosphatase family protein [Gloeomargarita lithophora]APB34979.1 phosphoglycerate mutase family protein [Gloeomargarita lithophora Alchichica-D10]